MQLPNVADLPPDVAGTARAVAERLARRGHRAWIVGGAVRDLALGLPVKDLDLATAARPEEIEELFERTTAVGRSFGTLVVHAGPVDCQVTTFRREGAYGDGRRPDEVSYGTSLEEDARRRDFTVNALYLDPLTGELRDPTGGLPDVEARRLRCVGDPAARFAEDGLRVLRLARLAASRGLGVEAETLRAASASRDGLRGVSRERVLQELLLAVGSGRAAVTLALLERMGAAEAALGIPLAPGRLAAVERLGDSDDPVAFFAALFAPDPAGPVATAAEARERLLALRASRELLEGVQAVWGLLERIAAAGGAGRPERVRLVRDPAWGRALAVARALSPPELDQEALAGLELFERALAPEERFPEPLVGSADLRELGLPAGPAWSELLEEAETERLAGRHTRREEALAWLAERVRALRG